MGGEDTEPSAGPQRIIRPFDPATNEIVRLTSVDDIIEFDRSIRSVTEGLPRPIRIGSIFRAGEFAYPQWGVEVNDSNRAELEELATWHYVLDAEEGRNEAHSSDDLKYVKKKLSSDSLESMALYIARMIKEIAVAVDDGARTFRVCNIASGSGRLCSAIATAMHEEPDSEAVLERMEFHLVDQATKISRAEKNLDGSGLKIIPHAMLDDAFLGADSGKFDFVIMLSHMHRKPFLTPYLLKLRGALSEGGLLVSGDFHSIATQHPYYIYTMLKEMGVENWRLNKFDELLGPLVLTVPNVLRMGEGEAVADHFNYWLGLNNEIGNRNYQGAKKVRILGAFTSTAQLGGALEKAGFCVDFNEIRKAFPEARLPRQFPLRVGDRTDRAAVTVAARLSRGV